MSIVTLWNVNDFYLGKESYESTLIFALILSMQIDISIDIFLRTDISKTTFYSYKKSNPVVNEIIFFIFK